MADEMIRWLYELQHLGVKLGLDNIRALLGLLDRPQTAYRCVQIAGTNGKGSVAAMIDAMLAAHEVPSGLFTSPHLVRPNERIRIAGADIESEELDRQLERMRRRIESALATGELEVHPSFFEVITATALQSFKDRGMRVAVLEVGLGGRLDATSAVDPDVGVVVGVDLDHMKTLGASLEQIAAEKAGIVKSGMPVVSGVVQQRAIDVLDRVCSSHGAPLIDARRAVRLCEEDGSGFTFATAWNRYPGLRLSLDGRHQIDNARVAVAAFELLMERLGIRPDVEAVRAGLKGVRWPGRLQWIDGEDGAPGLLLDAAHNPAGMATLIAYLRGRTIPSPVLLFGATLGKPVRQLLEPLAALARTAVITRPPVHKGIEPSEVEPVAGSLFDSIRVEPDVAAALALARRIAAPDGCVLVTGSLYLVGEVLGQVRGETVPGPVAM